MLGVWADKVLHDHLLFLLNLKILQQKEQQRKTHNCLVYNQLLYISYNANTGLITPPPEGRGVPSGEFS